MGVRATVLITGITYPSGRSVEYTRDSIGDVSAVSTTAGGLTAPLASQVTRAPFGPVTSLMHGNGLQETRTLDQSYRVTAINVPGAVSRSYRYTADSNVEAIDNLLLGAASQSYDYDAADRLTGALGVYGARGFEYDANSNRTALVDDGVRDRYTISTLSNQLTRSGAVSYSYDANGNQIERGADTFTYDSENRLISATVAGVTARYGYNHLHQRVTKSLDGHSRLFLYDQAGNILSEVDGATGEILAEYVWLDSTPLAYIEAGTTYQIHTDHLGTPQVLTDGAGHVAWEAHYTPFGHASVSSQGPSFNLRFPGQYFDAETGLHYNWHRYYDPGIGRYITSDPIGLDGGINTYVYALNDPILLSDPLGLWVPQAVGAAVNTGFEGYRQYQAGEFSPQRLLVAAATGAMGGFGSTAARAIGFGALSGSTQNAFNQVLDFDNECNRIGGGFMSFDAEPIVRGAFFGGLGGAGGSYGSGIGRRLYKKQEIRGMPLDKKISLNYESEGAAIGTALGTAYGNQ